MPIADTSGKIIDDRRSDFPNRGRAWWMLRGEARATHAPPGCLIMSGIEDASDLSSAPDKDIYQLLQPTLPGPKDLLEILSPDAKISDPNELLDGFAATTNRIIWFSIPDAAGTKLCSNASVYPKRSAGLVQDGFHVHGQELLVRCLTGKGFRVQDWQGRLAGTRDTPKMTGARSFADRWKEGTRMLRGAANDPRGDCFFAVTAVTAVTVLIPKSYFCNGAAWATRYARYTIDSAPLFKKAHVKAKQTLLGSPSNDSVFCRLRQTTRACCGSKRGMAAFSASGRQNLQNQTVAAGANFAEIVKRRPTASHA